MKWYFILGLLTVLIGGYRQLKNKQSLEIGELDTLMWFLFWWIYLPIFLIDWFLNCLRKQVHNESNK